MHTLYLRIILDTNQVRLPPAKEHDHELLGFGVGDVEDKYLCIFLTESLYKSTENTKKHPLIGAPQIITHGMENLFCLMTF